MIISHNTFYNDTCNALTNVCCGLSDEQDNTGFCEYPCCINKSQILLNKSPKPYHQLYRRFVLIQQTLDFQNL